ncbi:MAG: aminopeptidase [Granulosicoccus sp.]
MIPRFPLLVKYLPYKILTLLLASTVLAAGSGCSSVGYYSQAVGGHLKLMRARQPIAEVLADEATSPELREKLQTLVEARQFAVTELGLPDNDSYSTFVETGKAAVTWNVVAATEFSVRPKTWCFPIAGCVSYRGYFDRADADAYAAGLAEENFDVTVGGASAYSTLGWFDDPILDTMLRGNDTRYVSTLFHELAHQVLYVKDDSNFNEAYASFVEQVGTRMWLEQRGEPERIAQYDASLKRVEEFVNLLQDTRKNLQATFAKDIDEDTMRAEKAAVFEQMRAGYESLKVEWGGFSGYDNWFKRDLNNARLVAVATYRRYVPAFYAMYIEAGEDLQKFYEVASVTAELPADERRERLDAYLAALNATS